MSIQRYLSSWELFLRCLNLISCVNGTVMTTKRQHSRRKTNVPVTGTLSWQARRTSGDAGVKLWKKSEHFALPVGSAVCNSESTSHHLKTSCFLFSCLRKMGKKFWSFPIHACNYDKNCKRIIIFLKFPILCWLNPVVNAIMIWICMPFLEIFF